MLRSLSTSEELSDPVENPTNNPIAGSLVYPQARDKKIVGLDSNSNYQSGSATLLQNNHRISTDLRDVDLMDRSEFFAGLVDQLVWIEQGF